MKRISTLGFLRPVRSLLSPRRTDNMPIKFDSDRILIETKRNFLTFYKTQVVQVVFLPSALHFAIEDDDTPVIEIPYDKKTVSSLYTSLRSEIPSKKIRWLVNDIEPLAKATSGVD